MTLNMKNYKGFDKLPYCGAHVPKAKATTVADTPEMRRLAENSKIQVGRCNDFLNIFAEKFAEKNWRFFAQNKAKLCKNCDHNIGFEKNAIFSPKMGKNRRKLLS
jgi:hypothetical protein